MDNIGPNKGLEIIKLQLFLTLCQMSSNVLYFDYNYVLVSCILFVCARVSAHIQLILMPTLIIATIGY